jgi:hypothetical protein
MMDEALSRSKSSIMVSGTMRRPVTIVNETRAARYANSSMKRG